MKATEKAKVKRLMKSQHGLVRQACTAAGVSRFTYYNIIRGNSEKNIDSLNKIIAAAKELKASKVIVQI